MAHSVSETSKCLLIPSHLLLWMILLPLICSAPTDSELDLPPYLRGIGWRSVEMELKKDMRLTPSVRPISYDFNLNVRVRGYDGAERSTFRGSVIIALNVSSPISEIELHAVGLNIRKAELKTSSSVIEITSINYNHERETVIIGFAQMLLPTVSAKLKIYYNGTSQSRGIGLYESWTSRGREETSPPPIVSLVTHCEPTGARRWFPSFDEPDKKSTFRLRLTHPSNLTAYSNTKGQTKALNSTLSETVFERTVRLPTYAVAMALTEQSATEVEHNGQKIRAIGKYSEDIVRRLIKSIDHVKSLPVFRNVTFIPAKTDWLIVEDFVDGAMENPGLITSKPSTTSNSVQIHELVHMYFGNLVTLGSWEQIWLNEGFARFYQPQQHYYSADVLRRATLHEPAMHSSISYTRSQFVTDRFKGNIHVHYDKAGQLLRLIKRFIGEEAFDRALNRYLIKNSFGNGDSETMIDYLSAENPEVRQIMKDWVYQPGVALLTVDLEDNRVIIEQRRFIRTDFYQAPRDTKTRWTIPLYYTIDGVEHMDIFTSEFEKFILQLPANSTFSIDETYPYLYAVHYKNKDENREIKRRRYIEKETREKDKLSESVIVNMTVELPRFCHYEQLLNKSKEELMEKYLIEEWTAYLECNHELKNRDNAKQLLRELLVSNELPVRNYHVGKLAYGINRIHHGILLEFLTEENTNIDYLYGDIWDTIKGVSSGEAGGMEKLREIVRVNPSFAANFYHIFTKIFELNFIEKELKSFDPSAEDDLWKELYYYLM